MRRFFFVFCLFVLCVLTVFAQSFGSVDNADTETETIVDDERGFSAQVDIDIDVFRLSSAAFTDAKSRNRRADYFLIDNYPFGGLNILDDTNAVFGYNGSWYGGKLTLNKNGLGGIKAWVSFLDGKIKISAGDDIGYSYADAQGADAGLRVYDDHLRSNNSGVHDEDDKTIDSNKNPDNITQDKGLLVEFDFQPVKIALAGGGNFEDIVKNMGSFMNSSEKTDGGNVTPLYGHKLQYGVNVGSEIADGFAKINAAYIFQSVKKETLYIYDIFFGKYPENPYAHVMHHLFGVYAGIYPFRNDTLGITLGYAGIFTQNLAEFGPLNSKTAAPTVFKNGINLNARYQNDTLTIKTDHNVSFWFDRNRKIFYLYRPNSALMKDYGLDAETSAESDVSDVMHLFIWNGIGASYRFTPLLQGSVYVRNLIRIDTAPEYSMINDYFALELKSIFSIGENVEAYAGLTYNMTLRSVSKSLAERVGEFKEGIPAQATIDTLHTIQIPVGVTIKLR